MNARASSILGLAASLAILSTGAAAAPDWYEARGARPPQGNRVYVCHAYSCRMVTPVTLTAAEIEAIAAPLAAGTADAESERAALSVAVQVFETTVGGRVGTSVDLPGMQFGRGRPDQMDCIDEATNTTSLLRLLAGRGLLQHHDVLEPRARGFLLDGRYPHATAMLAESVGGEKWAIDSWPRANGGAPVIQPYDVWRRSRGGALPS